MWYVLLRAARALSVAPWELAEQPATWLQWALRAQEAEHWATAEMQKRARIWNS
jgi:hypothetical protein